MQTRYRYTRKHPTPVNNCGTLSSCSMNTLQKHMIWFHSECQTNKHERTTEHLPSVSGKPRPRSVCARTRRVCWCCVHTARFWLVAIWSVQLVERCRSNSTSASLSLVLGPCEADAFYSPRTVWNRRRSVFHVFVCLRSDCSVCFPVSWTNIGCE